MCTAPPVRVDSPGSNASLWIRPSHSGKKHPAASTRIGKFSGHSAQLTWVSKCEAEVTSVDCQSIAFQDLRLCQMIGSFANTCYQRLCFGWRARTSKKTGISLGRRHHLRHRDRTLWKELAALHSQGWGHLLLRNRKGSRRLQPSAQPHHHRLHLSNSRWPR